MANNNHIIDFICEGGFGGEAKVKVELRTEFPGIGGTIVTQEGIATAWREEYDPVLKSGHEMFIKHTIIKKLDDYFHRIGIYKFPHVSRPLGSVSKSGVHACEAYIYEWSFGSVSFPWKYYLTNGNPSQIKLHDWGEFTGAFLSAGIDLGYDICDANNGDISQNIVHQYPFASNSEADLNCLWKRIDFGDKSIQIDYKELLKFLRTKEKSLRRVLRSERYEMIMLAYEYLTNLTSMSGRNIGRLDALLGDYRLSSMRHHTSRGAAGEQLAFFGKRSEDL